MHQYRTRLAFGLLLAFLAGGVAAPLLHGLHHAEQWQARQDLLHHHAAPSVPAVHDACPVAGVEAQDCYLCHRDLVGAVLSALPHTATLQPSAPVVHRSGESLGAGLPLLPIRAPPLQT